MRTVRGADMTKPRLNRGFLMCFQKSRYFVLSARVAPCHFLVDYSIKKSDVAFPSITPKDLPNKDGKHDE